MVAPDALGSLADVEFAARITVARSACGDVLIQLHRPDGEVFAAAGFSPAAAETAAGALCRFAAIARVGGGPVSGGVQ